MTHKTFNDWIESTTLETLSRFSGNHEIETMKDMILISMHFHRKETGVEGLKKEEIFELVQRLKILCAAEVNVRLGYAERHGEILFTDPEIGYGITDKGRIVAQMLKEEEE